MKWAGAKTVTVLALACGLWAASAYAQRRPRARLNTLTDVRRAILNCWSWPPAIAVRTGMELTIMLTFKRDGEIFGAHVTYESPNVSADERAAYYRAMVRSLARCSPLPVTPELGEAIAGRPFYFHFRDVRKQRKA